MREEDNQGTWLDQMPEDGVGATIPEMERYGGKSLTWRTPEKK